MNNVGIIGSADGPTAIYVAENAQEIVVDNINDRLNERTMAENLDSGIKIMGLGMVAVFGVLTVLYIIVKIMGLFAKGKDKDEKN